MTPSGLNPPLLTADEVHTMFGVTDLEILDWTAAGLQPVARYWVDQDDHDHNPGTPVYDVNEVRTYARATGHGYRR